MRGAEAVDGLLSMGRAKLAMVMELVEGGDLCGQLHDPFRLRSRVYGLVKCINATFFDFKSQFSFKRVFLNSEKLTAVDRELMEAKIVGLLAEPRVDAIGWIQEQFDQNSRSVELSRLNSANPITDLGMTAEQLEQLGCPKPPILATLGDGALEKTRRAFREWKEDACVRGLSGLIEPIENWQQRFFEGVEELFGMWVADVSGNEIRRMAERMQEIEDGIEILSREQALIVAPVNEALRLKLAIDIARGMMHLHELNPPLVHRDLKTPNVFLTRSLVNFPFLDSDDDESWRIPLAKVGDFGFSLLSMQSQSFQIRDRAEDDPLLNINAWAAPELLSGYKYSTPVDVYAMGILLWELLLRQHPFSEIPMHQIASKVIAGQRPVIPASMTQDTNLQEYIELMSRCWHPNPSLRPLMREVYNSLRDICKVRCPVLPGKLLPPPVPKSAVSRREQGENDHDTAPNVTWHLFVAPVGSSASAAPVPRVTCMHAPLKQQELLWLGLESGHVALADYRHGDPQRETLRWIQCQDGDKHQQRVNAINHLSRNSDEEGTVWTKFGGRWDPRVVSSIAIAGGDL